MTTILNNMQCKKYNINISYHSCIFYINDKNVAPGGNPECSKNIFFLQKWVDFFYFILLLPKIKELMLCMKYRQNRFAGYFEKHSGVAKCHSGPKTRRLPKFEIDIIFIKIFLNRSYKFVLYIIITKYLSTLKFDSLYFEFKNDFFFSRFFCKVMSLTESLALWALEFLRFHYTLDHNQSWTPMCPTVRKICDIT